MPEVTYNVYPDNRRRPMVQTLEQYEQEISRVKSALSVKLISENAFDLIVLASGYEYERHHNMGRPWPFVSNGNAKTWWNGGYAFEAVMPGRNPDNSWATEENTESVEGLQWTTRELMDFYKAYRSHFPRVPRFATQKFDAVEAGRCQFGDGPAVDFPLAKISRNADTTANFRTTLPPGIGFKIENDQLLWFKLADYRAAFPITTAATVPPPVARPSGVVLMTIGMIYNNPNLSVDDKLAQIKAQF